MKGNIMAVTGDSYIVELKRAHLEWGTHRYTGTRNEIYGEGYLHLPRQYAERFEIYNSNYTGGDDILGINIFNCRSVDGLFEGVIKAQGCSGSGDIYAKQFSVNGDLRALGDWYGAVGAEIGDRVRVTWTSPTDIEIELL